LNEDTDNDSGWKIPAFYPDNLTDDLSDKIESSPFKRYIKNIKDEEAIDSITTQLSQTALDDQSERQGHGLVYEDHVIEKYKLIKADNYTSPYDAFYNDAGVVYPVQIKAIKMGAAIEMGDLKRNITKKEDFILVVGFWETTKVNIVREDILYVDHLKYRQYVECHNYDDMKNDMSKISNDRTDDSKWKEFCNKYKCTWSPSNIFDVRFKRDHKKQKRIQCAISWSKYNNIFVKVFKQFNFKRTDLKANEIQT
jgi:hypothetical protein